jgi:hypothetical protein
MEADKKRWFLS